MKVSNKIKFTIFAVLAVIILSFNVNSVILPSASCFHNGVYFGQVPEDTMCEPKHQLINPDLILHTGTDPEECLITAVQNKGGIIK